MKSECCVCEDGESVIEEIEIYLRWAKCDLEDEACVDTIDDIDGTLNKYEKVYDQISDTNDIIERLVLHSEELIEYIIILFDDSLSNDGKLNIFDHIYIDREKRNEFMSIWKQMNRKNIK